MSYVSIDIETTGLDWRTCQTIEIGAVIDDWETPIEDLPKFRCYVNHDLFQGEPYALSMHPEIFREIAKSVNGVAPNGVMVLDHGCVSRVFIDWLTSNGLRPNLEKITVAGKNFAAFDRNFLDKLKNWEWDVKMHHRIIDPGNMYYIPGVDNAPPDTAECLRRAKLSPVVSHKALDDALDVVRLIRYKMEKSQ